MYTYIREGLTSQRVVKYAENQAEICIGIRIKIYCDCEVGISNVGGVGFRSISVD